MSKRIRYLPKWKFQKGKHNFNYDNKPWTIDKINKLLTKSHEVTEWELLISLALSITSNDTFLRSDSTNGSTSAAPAIDKPEFQSTVRKPLDVRSAVCIKLRAYLGQSGVESIKIYWKKNPNFREKYCEIGRRRGRDRVRRARSRMWAWAWSSRWRDYRARYVQLRQEISNGEHHWRAWKLCSLPSMPTTITGFPSTIALSSASVAILALAHSHSQEQRNNGYFRERKKPIFCKDQRTQNHSSKYSHLKITRKVREKQKTNEEEKLFHLWQIDELVCLVSK